MKPVSRKQYRFMAFMLLLWAWNISPVWAQEFDPVSPTETLVQEIADGTATLSQYEELAAFAAQQRLTDDITQLLEKDTTTAFFDKNFDADGLYGEQKNGLIVQDWETLAKGMGTTGAVLAGAYAVWRSRRREYLKQLRAGDAAALEKLFASEFGKPIANGLDPLTPDTPGAWEAWAQAKGVAGTGALVATLFAVWQRRKLNELGDHEILSNHWNQQQSTTDETSIDKFVLSATALLDRNIREEYEDEATALYTRPTAPSKNQAVLDYEKAQTELQEAEANIGGVQDELTALETEAGNLNRNISTYTTYVSRYQSYLNSATINYNNAVRNVSSTQSEIYAVQREKNRIYTAAEIDALFQARSQKYSAIDYPLSDIRTQAYYAANDFKRVGNTAAAAQATQLQTLATQARTAVQQINRSQYFLSMEYDKIASYEAQIERCEALKIIYPHNATTYQNSINFYQSYIDQSKVRAQNYQTSLENYTSQLETTTSQISSFNTSAIRSNTRIQGILSKISGAKSLGQQYLEAEDLWLMAKYSDTDEVALLWQEKLNDLYEKLNYYRRLQTIYSNQKNNYNNYLTAYQNALNTAKSRLSVVTAEQTTAQTQIAAYQLTLNQAPETLDQYQAHFDAFKTAQNKYVADLAQYTQNRQSLWQKFADRLTGIGSLVNNFVAHRHMDEREAFYSGVYPPNINWLRVGRDQFHSDVVGYKNQLVARELTAAQLAQNLYALEISPFADYVTWSDLPIVPTSLQSVVAEARAAKQEFLLAEGYEWARGNVNYSHHDATAAVILDYIEKNRWQLGWQESSTETSAYSDWRTAQFKQIENLLGIDTMKADIAVGLERYAQALTNKKARDTEIANLRDSIEAQYKPFLSSDMFHYYSHKRDLARDEITWNSDLEKIASASHGGQTQAYQNQRLALLSAFDDWIETLDVTQLSNLTEQTEADHPAVKQTLGWFANHSQNALVVSAQEAIGQVWQINRELEAQSQTSVTASKWIDRHQAKLEMKRLNAAKQAALKRIADVRTQFLFVPADAEEKGLHDTIMAREDAETALAQNAVHQWVEAQRQDREFAEKYGVYDRASYIEREVAEIAALIDQAEAQGVEYLYVSEGYKGMKYVGVSNLKRQIEFLRNNEIVNVLWSPSYTNGEYNFAQGIPYSGDDALNNIYYRIRTYDGDIRSEHYLNLLAERDNRIAQLATERGEQWESQQVETLTSKFSAAQIAAYQALKKTAEDHQAQQTALEEAQAIVQRNFEQGVRAQNTVYAASRGEILNPIPFTADELEAVALSVSGGGVVPSHLKDVYFEAYRRYQTDQEAFASEVIRLAQQAKDMARRDAIASRNIPKEPVADKQVTDYLNDAQRTIDDVNREIAEQEAAIPILKEKYANNPSFLTTALRNAELHIAALIEYRDGSIIAAQEYLAAKDEYETKYQPILAEIDQQLVAQYETNVADYVAAYFPAAANLLAERNAAVAASEDSATSTNPENVELAQQYEQREAVAEQVVQYGELKEVPDSFNEAFSATYNVFNTNLNNSSAEFVATLESDSTNRWEDPQWVDLMVRLIRGGEVDMVNFIGSPPEEKVVLLEAAQKSKGWITWGEEERRLGHFIRSMNDQLEIDRIKNFFFQQGNQLLLDLIGPKLFRYFSDFATASLVTVEIARHFATAMNSVIDFYQSVLNAEGVQKEAADHARKQVIKTIQQLGESVSDNLDARIALTEKLGQWHFEERHARNTNLPSYEEAIKIGSDWFRLPNEQNLLHDNHTGLNEVKFVDKNGREVVFDGSTKDIVTDPNLMGTFNYGILLPDDHSLYREGFRDYDRDFIMHGILDVLPYYALGGNIR